MKWFLALLLALNLFVAGVSLLRQHEPVDIHATEVDPGKLKVLPADWLPTADASAAVASIPLPQSAASAPLAAALQASAPAAKSVGKTKPVSAQPASASATHAAVSVQKPAAAVEKKPTPVLPGKKPLHTAQASAPAARSPLQCAQWGDLNDTLLARVQGGLPALKLSAGQMASAKTEAGEPSGPGVRYWVYYPAGAAAGLSAELKGKGFDNYAVQNAGEFKGALSLGLYGKREAAQAMLDRLKGAGYPKAALLARGKGQGGKTRLSFKSLDEKQFAALTALQKRLTPGIVLKSSACGR